MDYWQIFLRRRWWIVVPALVISLSVFVISTKLPKLYKSETLILVDPQKVPTEYVRPTISGDVSDRLQTISQEILSRTRLQKIIDQFGLYKDQKNVAQEDIVEMMRKGLSPTDACLEALHRVARNYNNDKRKLDKFHIFFYALNKDGVHGSAALWEKSYDGKTRSRYAVHDGSSARELECAYLYEGGSVED